MDHDRNFKELLSAIFLEFIDLFLPDIASYLDRSCELIPMDKEVFTDVTMGERHEVDLLMRAKVQAEDAFFLVRVENQATANSDFPKRMFRYFARLTEKYDLPVYPVALFSYDQPQREEPELYEVGFPGKIVLQFRYRVIQLSRLDWRSFARTENPLASALMAKMRMNSEDRPKVRLECLRLLASLKLDPARSKLIGGFIDSYLRLTSAELAKYEREIEELAPKERMETMALISSWEQKGIEEGISQGILEGKEGLLSQLILHRFGAVPPGLMERIQRLSSSRMDDLGKSLLDSSSPADVDRWLTQHSSQQ